MGQEAVVVKNGLRLCGTGSARGSAPILQDKVGGGGSGLASTTGVCQYVRLEDRVFGCFGWMVDEVLPRPTGR